MKRESFGVGRWLRIAAVLTITVLALSHRSERSLAEDGIGFSFGFNAAGQAGQGTLEECMLVATRIDTTNLSGKMISQVAAGQLHSLLLADDGTVFSFGSRSETGLGTAGGNVLIATPIDTTNLAGKTITQVAAGGGHSLLLADDGTVFSFGSNWFGRTGQGTTTGNTLVATPIDTTNLAGRTITQIAAGGYHCLLLADDGTVFSFGQNDLGQTGLGIDDWSSTTVATPIDTTNLAGKTISQVAAGWDHSLLLADDGTVFSFGDNWGGATGLGADTDDTLIATPIDATNLGGKTITQVAAGAGQSLLLADDGTVFSFGWNGYGETGLGTSDGSTLIATPIDTTNLGGETITQVAAGASHSLLLADDGTVFSFGWNGYGETGLGTTDGSTLVATPIDTVNLSGMRVIGLSAGVAHNLLLAVPVPEPGGATLVLLAGVWLLVWRRRR
jgi:alpha-tubulin suppressor-like RCC1 family protein